MGPVVGLFFVPNIHVLWERGVTERDQVITFLFVNMQGTLAGAAIGLFVRWRAARRVASLPTDDSGRR